MAKAARFHGKRCDRCGKTLRYVTGRQCVRCKLAYGRIEYLQFRDEQAAATKAWHEANRDQHNETMRIGQLKRKFGLSPEQYELWLSMQHHACAVCHSTCPTGRRLAVDHDHATGRIRGLLCQGCNTGIGKFGDDPLRLEAAARYLRLAAFAADLTSDSENTTIELIHRPEKDIATPVGS